MNLKKILIRSFSGLLYIAIIVGAILWGRPGITLLSVIFGTIATIEFTKITKGLSAARIPALIADAAGVICLALGSYFLPMLVWIFCVVCRLVIELYANEEDALRSLAYSMMIQVYIGMPMFVLTAFSEFLAAPHLLLAIFIFIWLNDTGAFLVGCTIGRHKLFERISPKKSWEGFFGGLAFCLGFSVLFYYVWGGWFGMRGSIWIWLGLAALTSVFATWGDLVESLIKRNLHIKDSGNIIPGHGGILDRIDSLLLVLPATFLYLFFVEAV